MARACKEHGLPTPANEAGLNHLSLRADGQEVEQVVREACSREAAEVPNGLRETCVSRKKQFALHLIL